MTQSKSRPWYQLHGSTWVVLGAVLAALVLIIVPGIVCGSGFPGPNQYEHGWPFIYLDRVAWPQGGRVTRDQLHVFPSEDWIRRAWARGGDSDWGFQYGGEPLWMTGSNWPLSGESAVSWPGLAADLAVVLAICAAIAVSCEWWRRKFWQYRVRSLVILALLISGVLVWWGTAAAQCAREQRLIAALQRQAFDADFVCAAPVWLSRLVGEKRLPFRVVGISGPNIWRESAADGERRGERNLRDTNQPARVALELAKDLPHLASVFLMIQADDLTVAHLAGLERITCLQIHETRITNEGMKTIGRLWRLEELELSSMEGCDNGNPVVAAQVTDAGLEHLRSLTRLEQLTLDGIPITDAGLEHLRGLTGLRELTLYNTKVTDEGVRKLRKALPDCEIEMGNID